MTPGRIGFIARQPLLTYYALAFTISWGGMLLVIGGPSGLPAKTGMAFLTWFVILTVALWVVVAAVAIANGRQLSAQPIRLRRT